MDIMETDFKESTKDDSRTSRETHHIVRKVALCNTSDNAHTHAWCEKYVHLATGNVTFEREVCRVHFGGQFWSGKQLEEKTSERRRFTRGVVTPPSSSSSRKCADSAHHPIVSLFLRPLLRRRLPLRGRRSKVVVA